MVTITKSGTPFSFNGEETMFSSFRGLSTDEKPTNVPENSLFMELDTGVGYYFSEGEWKVYAANKPEGLAVSAAIVG